MSALAQQQQALLDALFSWPADDAVRRLNAHCVGVGTHAQRGILAYQANGHALAERALQSAYPVVAQMLGAQSFADLARALWHAHPPAYGDVAQWGGDLADFIAQSEQLRDEPFVPDVARAEWLLHRSSTVHDQDADLASLALLTTEDPATLGLLLSPGTGCIRSAWPIASIWLAHVESVPSFAEVSTQLRQRAAQDAVVWRHGLRPRLRLALPGEPALLSTLQAGTALQPALAQADELDFPQWLPLAVQTGLVLGAYRISMETQQ